MCSNSDALTKDKLVLQLGNNYICGLISYQIFAPPSLEVEVQFKLNNIILFCQCENRSGRTHCFSIFMSKVCFCTSKCKLLEICTTWFMCHRWKHTDSFFLLNSYFGMKNPFCMIASVNMSTWVPCMTEFVLPDTENTKVDLH